MTTIDDVLNEVENGRNDSGDLATEIAESMMNISSSDRYDNAMKFQTPVGLLTSQQFELAGFFIQQESVYRIISNMESVIWAERSVPANHIDEVADRLNRIREKQVSRKGFHEMGLDQSPDDESVEIGADGKPNGRHGDAVESDGPFTVKPKILVRRVDDPLMNAKRWLGVYDETCARGAISYRTKQPFTFEEGYATRVSFKKDDLLKVLSQREQEGRQELLDTLTKKMSDKVVKLWQKQDESAQQRYDDFCERLEDAVCRALELDAVYETPEDWELYWNGDDGDIRGIWNKATEALAKNTSKTGDEALADLLEIGEIESGL